MLTFTLELIRSQMKILLKLLVLLPCLFYSFGCALTSATVDLSEKRTIDKYNIVNINYGFYSGTGDLYICFRGHDPKVKDVRIAGDYISVADDFIQNSNGENIGVRLSYDVETCDAAPPISSLPIFIPTSINVNEVDNICRIDGWRQLKTLPDNIHNDMQVSCNIRSTHIREDIKNSPPSNGIYIEYKKGLTYDKYNKTVPVIVRDNIYVKKDDEVNVIHAPTKQSGPYPALALLTPFTFAIDLVTFPIQALSWLLFADKDIH